MKIAFFNLRPGEEEYLKTNLSEHELFLTRDPITPDQLPEQKDFEVVSFFTDSKIDAAVIDALPDLKYLAARSTGYDHVDLKTAEIKGIPVSNVPTYGENTVAEQTFALLLALSRRIVKAVNSVKDSETFNREGLQGFDLKGKTIGIIGTGHIGIHVIKLAKAFEMEVIAFDAFANQNLATDYGFKYVTLDELLASSDIISLHVPLLPETKNLINMENINKIKKGAVLINTARGEIVEAGALLTALEQGILSGAGLDVMADEESLRKGDISDEDYQINKKIIDMESTLVTPHNAANTKEAYQRIMETTVDNIKSFISGAPKNLVKPHP